MWNSEVWARLAQVVAGKALLTVSEQQLGSSSVLSCVAVTQSVSTDSFMCLLFHFVTRALLYTEHFTRLKVRFLSTVS